MVHQFWLLTLDSRLSTLLKMSNNYTTVIGLDQVGPQTVLLS